MTLSQGGLFVMQFGASLVIARLLTPYEMGVFAVAAAIVGLLSTLRALGLAGYIVRAADPTTSLLAATFTINAAIACLVSALIVGLSLLGASLLDEPGVERVLLAMAILPLIAIFEFLPAAGIERRGNFRVVALVNLVRAVSANSVMLVLAYSGFSYMSLAYGQIAGAVAAVLVINVIGRRHVSLRVGITGWRDIIRYGLEMLAISGISTMTSRFAELVLGRLLGLDALGLYSRASGLNSLLWENVHLVISRIVFVDFSEQRRQGRSLRHGYLRIVRMVTGLLWPAFAGLAVIAGPLVMTLYGETWVGAAVPLSLLSVAAMVGISTTMAWEVFVVSQETARQVRIESWRSGAALALFAAGCLISLAAAAAARIGESFVAVLLYRKHLQRMTDTHPTDYVPIYRQGCVLTILAILPALLVMSFYHWSPQAPVPAVLGAVAAGIAAWMFGLWNLRHPLFDEGCLILSSLRNSLTRSAKHPKDITRAT